MIYQHGLFDPDMTQRWNKRKDYYQHRAKAQPFDTSRYDVERILDNTTAKRFVEEHHYSGTYPAARKRYGVFERGTLVGVAALSVPVNVLTLTDVFPHYLPNFECLELGRFILLDRVPFNAETWFLARMFELALLDGIKGLVSFSDPEPRLDGKGGVVFPGHVGTIYQAKGATYLGKSYPKFLHLFDDGQSMNARAIQKIRKGTQGYRYAEEQFVQHGAKPRKDGENRSDWLAQAMIDARIRKVKHHGNHRYAFTLAKERTTFALPVFPYPKRGAA